MTIRTYSNYQSPTKVVVRSGSVNTGLNSNNYYWRNDGFSTEDVVATELFYDYREWPVRTENRLHAKLTEAIAGGGKAQLLTAAAEWRSTLDMITLRVLQLTNSYKRFRSGDIAGATRQLVAPAGSTGSRRTAFVNERGFTSPNRRKKEIETQTATAGWLEYWMGWAPTMGDIYAALDVLQRPFPKQHISKAVGYEQEWTERFNYPMYMEGSQQIKHKGSLGVYADMEITNYNLFLMNQMGLVNPLSTGYQILPFSFILNWFVNIEQCLNALTDFAGVTLTNTGMAHYQAREGSRSVVLYDWVQFEDGNWRQVPRLSGGKYTGYSRLRIPGQLPTVQLVTKFDRLSVTRAATAVSLLVEIFLRKRN